MPRLSLWRPNKGNDYKFIDKNISEQFTVGGTDINIHKYLGPLTGAGGNSATEPTYLNDSAKNIQDLLFLENRDRKYDADVYTLRGIYRINDNDFDLTQFGLFLTGDTLFMVFHLNDMIETIGRKIMVGDVFELPHLKDFFPLDEGLPVALKRYYVVQDATRAAEGFSPTWYPHLWRVKLTPLVDSQEYKDILNSISAGDTNGDGTINSNDNTLGDILSTYNNYIAVNDAVVMRAEEDVPYSGYDTTPIYHEPVLENGYPGNPEGTANVTTSSASVEGYLTGDGIPPNGAHVDAGLAFPGSPQTGDFYLRLDYVPNRLFRYDGRRWVKIEDKVRTNLTPGYDNKTQLSGFINNTTTYYTNALVYDAIRVSDPYVPVALAQTQSFTLSNKTIITKTPFVSTYGVKTVLNNLIINNTLSNVSGNIAITVSSTLVIDDLLEYTVYANATPERQSLSQALRPTADN